MPPKTRITKEMIVDAAFEIVREDGIENVNARTISNRLDCSTQPVLYQFRKMEDIKRAIYDEAASYHLAYITKLRTGEPLKEFGRQYLQFVETEGNLFRFLQQPNGFSEKNFEDLLRSKEISALLSGIERTARVSRGQAEKVFKSFFLFVHGYACLLANHMIEYDEGLILSELEQMYTGVVYAVKGGQG